MRTKYNEDLIDPFDDETNLQGINKDNDIDLSILNNAPDKSTIIIKPSLTSAFKNENEEALKNLVNLDVDFRLINEKADKIISLKEVENSIIGDNNIDSVRAEVVAESFKDLFEYIPKNSFTKIPTKVNFNELIKFTRSSISKEEMVLTDMFKTYVGSRYEDAVSLLNKINDEYYPALVSSLDKERDIILELSDKINNPTNNVVGYKEKDFVKLNEVNLLALNNNDIRTKFKTTALFHESVNSIKEIFKCPKFINFYLRNINKEFILDVLNVTIKDLVNFANSDFIKLIDENKDKTNKCAKELVDVTAKGLETSSLPNVMSEFIVKNTDVFLRFNYELESLNSLIYRLNLLTLAVIQILEVYKEL